MKPTDLKAFIRKCLSRGMVGASVGFAAIASASTNKQAAPQPRPSFSQRLSNVRNAVSELIDEQRENAVPQQGVVPHPPPNPPHPPPPFSKFANWDNAAPWTNFDQKKPFDNFGKAPLK
jgi:hypothetical protein